MPPTIQYASLGMWDSLILMIMGLVVFGPRRLPQIGRQIGKLMYEFRKASNDFKFQMEEELRAAEEADRRQKEEQRLLALASSAPALTLPATSEAAAEQPYPSPYPNEDFFPAVTTPVEAPPAEPAPAYAPAAEADYSLPAELRPTVTTPAAEPAARQAEHHG